MPAQHPGKVLLQQYMAPKNLSQNALARAIRVPPRRINEIIHEKRGISADTAVRLSIYFGGSASYWMHLQAEYEIEQVRHQIDMQLASVHGTMHTAIEADPANNSEPGKDGQTDHVQARRKISRHLLR
jgi:antitoxin HigA-1